MAIRDTLALSEDQQDLQQTLRGFLAGQLPAAALRAALETEPGYSPELHARLAGEFGLAGLTIPAAFGGLGMSPAEASVVHTELGRALYPGPLLSTSLAAGVLATGDRAVAEGLLPRLADGSVTGTVAAADEAGRWAPGPGSVRARRASGGWRLYGHRWHVIAAHVADLVVVPAVTDAGPGMFLADPRSLGFTASGQLGLDLTRRVCVAAFDEAPALLLSQGGDAAAALAQAERDFLIATAAEAVGGIGWCVDTAIAFAGDRERSRRTGASFQAVAEACVEMLARFQSVSAAVRYAAVAAAAASPEAPGAAHVAALQAGEAYRAVTESVIRLLGGFGLTREHDAQLYYRRAWSAERLAGGPQVHRAAIAALEPHPSSPAGLSAERSGLFAS